MKRLLTLLPGVCLALIAFTAKADTATLGYVSSNGEIGPYTMLLNNSTSLQLFCMNNTDYIEGGEIWTVDVVNGADLATFFSTDLPLATEYQEEAYIYSQYNGSNATAVQEALWTITNTGYNGNGDPAAQDLVTDAGQPNSFYTDGDLSNYTFYLYDSNYGITNQDVPYPPQNFIGDAAAPEPSSLLMFGSALVGIAGVVRRKIVRA